MRSRCRCRRCARAIGDALVDAGLGDESALLGGEQSGEVEAPRAVGLAGEVRGLDGGGEHLGHVNLRPLAGGLKHRPRGACLRPELRARDGDEAEVVLCVEHKAKVREVHLGGTDEGRVLVLEGLAAGEVIVVDQPAGLEDDAELQEPHP